MPQVAAALELADVMTTLASRRAVFHSEADFQFEFAWTLANLEPTLKIRLEVPQRRTDGRSQYVDLICESETQRSLIEFKYITREWTGSDPQTGEPFALRNQAAIDLARFHFIHDVYRLEQWTGTQDTTNGFAVLLSNDPSLWKPAARSGTRDAAFRLDQDRVLTGNLKWGTRDKPYVGNDRDLRGTYTADWHDYAATPLTGLGGTFRWLGWAITSADPTATVASQRVGEHPTPGR